MLRTLSRKLRRLCSRLRRRRRHGSKKAAVKSTPQSVNAPKLANGSAAIHPNSGQFRQGIIGSERPENSVRVATFNASLFSMAPAVPNKKKTTISSASFELGSGDLGKPRGILKQSLSLNTESTETTPLASEKGLSKQQRFAKSKLRVSINLPDNEISRQLSFSKEREKDQHQQQQCWRDKERFVGGGGRRRTVVEVLRELDADILGLQDVKAEEEKGMKPLSDLAEALGMNYVFAESWAPEYGNAVLSKWPIKRWKAHRIFDHSDFRYNSQHLHSPLLSSVSFFSFSRFNFPKF